MPYIPGQARRFDLIMGEAKPVNPGELNYTICVTCLDPYFQRVGCNYESFARVIGFFTDVMDFTVLEQDTEPELVKVNALLNDYFRQFEANMDNNFILRGVCETIKLELYRRMIAPYEDMKKDANGDLRLFGMYKP